MSVIQRAVKALLHDNQRYFLRSQWNHLRTDGLADTVSWNAKMTQAWVRNRLGRGRYRTMSSDDMRAARRSDTVFIFGSGASLNDLPQSDWNHFAQHDVFGLNMFYLENWIPVGFHIVRGGVYTDPRWQEFVDDLAIGIKANPLFNDTIFILQEEYYGAITNLLVGSGALPTRNPIFRYHTARGDGPPTESFRDGLRHTSGTLMDAVNCAYLLGWKHLVLVGVDLYDSRYFFLPSDQTLGWNTETGTLIGAERNDWRGQTAQEPHNTVRNGVVDLLAQWGPIMAANGVELSVFNPRSLLAQVLPIYRAASSREAVR